MVTEVLVCFITTCTSVGNLTARNLLKRHFTGVLFTIQQFVRSKNCADTFPWAILTKGLGPY